MFFFYMGVSKNNGTPKSSILIRFSNIYTIHFGGVPSIFGNIQIDLETKPSTVPLGPKAMKNEGFYTPRYGL